MTDTEFVTFNSSKPIQEVLIELKEKSPFLQEYLDTAGGTENGWSRWSTYQRCQKAYEFNYVKKTTQTLPYINESLETGTLVHAYACLYYKGQDWTILAEAVEASEADPVVYTEARRVWEAYLVEYASETLKVLGVELEAKIDTYSCRYDLVVADYQPLGYHKGLWLMDHKCMAVFSNLEAWQMDGEILGQLALWDLAGFSAIYGQVQGAIINLIGKHKKPKFERIVVPNNRFLWERHMADMHEQQLEISQVVTIGKFRRSLKNCYDRYGKCQFFDRCRYGK